METIKGGATRLGEQLEEARKWKKKSCCKPPKLLMAALHMEGSFLWHLKQFTTKDKIFGIVLLVVGAEYHEKCVGNDAALFLVVAGPIMICMSLASLVAYLAKSLLKRRMDPHTHQVEDSSYALALLFGIADAAEKLLHLTFVGASIWGAVNFFGSYPTWESEDINHPLYCPRKAFWFSAKSLFPLVVILVVYPVLCIAFCIATSCSGKESQRKEQEEDPEEKAVREN